MSEISDTAILVKLGAEGSYFLLKGSVKGTMYLYQQLKKMKAARILNGGEVEDFERFLKATEGRYQILNIPTEDPNKISSMKADFDKMNVSYHILPDLNVGDGQIQIAYAIKDTQKVESWYRSFCLDHLQPGGEKTYRDLMNLTGGQVSVVNIPWRDADMQVENKEEAVTMLQDELKKRNIPNELLPNLNTEDGRLQILTPAYEASELTEWYKEYGPEKSIAEDLSIQSVDEYLRSGQMNEYTYVGSAGEKRGELLKGAMPDKQTKVQEYQQIPLEMGQERTLDELIDLTGGEVSVARIILPHIPEKTAEMTEKSPDMETASDERLEETQSWERQNSKSDPEGSPDMPTGIHPEKSLTREDSLKRLKEDLDKLHINYTILPDLNVGDGYVQIAFATADTPKLKAWYEAYQADMIAAGIPLEDMKEMPLEDYLETGKVRDERGTEPGKEPDRSGPTDIKGTAKKAPEEYYEMQKRRNMAEFSINEKLVQNPDANSKDGFVSRIPNSKEYFHVKPDMVYRTDGDKTYGIFADRDADIKITNEKGNFIRNSKIQDIEGSFAPIREGMQLSDIEIIYRKSEDLHPLMEKEKEPQEKITYKEPSRQQSKNKFNNFPQRNYDKSVWADLERIDAGLPPLQNRKTEFEHMLDEKEAGAAENIAADAGQEILEREKLVGLKEKDNGSVVFVAEIPETGQYYTAAADSVVRAQDNSIKEIRIARNKEVAVVDENAGFIRKGRFSEIVQNTSAKERREKYLGKAAEKAVKKSGPKSPVNPKL